jgi:small multidrug resistance family-3 protein
MESARVIALFGVTALAEIVGCYLPYLWLKRGGSILLLVPAAAALAAFVWLLTLHPHAAGRTYAAYGGIYVVTALAWLLLVQRIAPDRWDLIGGAITLVGMSIIYFGPRAAAQ